MHRKVYQEFVSANIIGVTVDHNGYCGGDAGHGGYVKITIKNLSSTCMLLNGKEVEDFELLIQGDCERDTFVGAFEMITKELKDYQSTGEGTDNGRK